MLQNNTSGLSQGNDGLYRGKPILNRGGGLTRGGNGLAKGKIVFPPWVNESIDEVENDDKIVFEDEEMARFATHFSSSKITPDQAKLMSDYSSNYARYPQNESDWVDFVKYIARIQDGEIPDPRLKEQIIHQVTDSDEDEDEPKKPLPKKPLPKKPLPKKPLPKTPLPKKSILEEAKKANRKTKSRGSKRR